MNFNFFLKSKLHQKNSPTQFPPKQICYLLAVIPLKVVDITARKLYRVGYSLQAQVIICHDQPLGCVGKHLTM